MDPLEVLRELRGPKCDGLAHLAKAARSSQREVKTLLTELGLWPAANRLWRMRGRRATEVHRLEWRASIVGGFQKFARLEGRPPGVQDAIAGALPFSHVTVIRYFGSWNEAVVAAGFQPRSRGAPGHLR